MQGIRYGCKYIIKFKVGGNILRVENLHEGQIIKNYKELCKILEIEEKPGKSRQLQHNHLRHCCCTAGYHYGGRCQLDPQCFLYLCI